MSETLDQYTRRLRKMKIKQLGSGAYSRVYAHPEHEDVAVKLLTDEDPRYLKFAKECMKLDNPWLPKVYSIEKVRFGDGEVSHLIFMERLNKPTAVKIKKASEVIQQDLPACLRINAGNFANFRPMVWRRVKQYTKDKSIKQMANLLAKIDTNDIHDGNVMMRGDQLVFTDPVAS